MSVTVAQFDPSALTYQGAFRLPAGTTFEFDGQGLAYRLGGTLFVACKRNEQPPKVAEVKLPDTLGTGTVASLPRATLVQGCKDPTEGGWSIVRAEANTPALLGGLLVVGDRLCGSLFGYYDAASKQKHSEWCRPLDLSDTGHVVGPVAFVSTPPITDGSRLVDGKLREYNVARFTNGYHARVPKEHQALFGGAFLLGSDPSTISGGASNGPDVFAVDLTALAENQSVLPAWYFTQQKPLNPWNLQSLLWNGTSETAGAFIHENAVVTLYHIGTGVFCYGPSTTTFPPPAGYCYDPANPNKGSHAYPYETRLMAFSLADIAKVKSGVLKPYELRPYASWTLDIPYSLDFHGVTGLDFDQASRQLFVKQPLTDGKASVVHVWEVR